MSPATFSVRALAEALGTERWRLSRSITAPGGLPAVRVRGRGSGGIGRGGQWRIDADKLLEYIKVPLTDWPEKLNDPDQVISKIILLSTIADEVEVDHYWARQVWLRTVQTGVPYGRNDALLPSAVADTVREKLRAEKGRS